MYSEKIRHLIRPEVFENRKRRLLGEVLLIQPAGFWLIFTLLLLSFGCAMLFFVWVKVPDNIQISGTLSRDPEVDKVF